MTLREQFMEYDDGATPLEGFFCYDDSRPGPLPAILVGHHIHGLDEFTQRKARRLAWHGYAVFAADMFGKGTTQQSVDNKRILMRALLADRAALTRRITLALTTVQGLSPVDARRVAGIGFCFGGLCVLDLARSGAQVRGVASVHGLLKPNGLPAQKLSTKILMLHGYDDPLAPPEDVLAIAQEFTAAGADWQLHAYGHTVHAFTNPNARDAKGGLLYNENADRRAWHALLQFFEEALR